MTKSLIFGMCLFTAPLLAQLAGTYTIGGTNPDFASIDAAASALDAVGVSAPVVMNIRPGTYTGLLTFYQMYCQFPTVFKSETNNAADVHLTMSNVYLGKLVGFKHITIYPLTNTNSLYPFKGLEVCRGEQISFDSCVFIGQNFPNNRNGITVLRSEGIEIRNCQFHNFENAVNFSDYTYAGSSMHHKMNRVSGCTFDSVEICVRAEGEVGAYQGDTMIITNNLMNKPQKGIYMDGYAGQMYRISISYNKIISPSQQGIEILYSPGYANNWNYIYNNMITRAGTGPASSRPGIFLRNSAYYKIYNNSVLGALLFYDGSNFEVMNNCLVDSASGVYIYYNFSGLMSDYNNLYCYSCTTLVATPIAFPTLDSLQSVMPHDQNSISERPYFFSGTDLHTTSPHMQFAGLPLSLVTDDIDREVRNNPAPDIGADEYHASPLPPFAYFEHTCGPGNVIQFNNISVRDSGSIWDFGDSNSSTLLSPSHTYTAPGNYNVRLIVSNYFGVDTIIKVINIPTVTIQTSLNTLYVTGSFLSYQWFLNGNPIPAATDSAYQYTFNGTYVVTVTDSFGCTATSAPVVINVGIEESDLIELAYWPNPTTNLLYVQYQGADQITVSLFDLSGKRVLEKRLQLGSGILNLTSLSSGMYLIKFSTGEKFRYSRLIKE